MVVTSDKEKMSSIYAKEPKIALTEWRHYRTDAPGHKELGKPAIRNYTLIATTVKTFGAADVEDAAHSSLIEDWDNTIKLLEQAQRTGISLLPNRKL